MKDGEMKVLLIDDDPDETLLMTEMMTQGEWAATAFVLVCAESMAAGLKQLRSEPFSVVLLDLMLGPTQGLETYLRFKREAPEVPVVVITGLQDERIGLEAVRQGAQDYLIKGTITENLLKRALSYAVERHRLTAQIQDMIDGAADAMLVVDVEGIVQYANRAAEQLFEKSADQMVGRRYPYDNNISEIAIPSKKGGDKIAEMRVSKVNWRGRPAFLSVIRDITELKRIEQLRSEIRERQRLDQLKDELMNTVSHEIRSPLTIIKGGIDSLWEGLAGPLTEPQETLVRIARNNVHRVTRFVINLLDLSRLESGKAIIRKQKVDMKTLIADAVEGYRLAEKRPEISISSQLPAEFPPAEGDPDLIAQVLDNLIDNAIRYSRSRVSVSAEPAVADSGEKEIRVIVKDDGPGIPAERLQDLFNKFVQVSRPREKGYKGTGLGLAICKEIIERLDGRIWAESPPGQGTAMHIALPQHQRRETGSPSSPIRFTGT